MAAAPSLPESCLDKIDKRATEEFIKALKKKGVRPKQEPTMTLKGETITGDSFKIYANGELAVGLGAWEAGFKLTGNVRDCEIKTVTFSKVLEYYIYQ